jgi:hypothetical protein
VLGEVATLQHELGDNTMETRTCVSVAVLASRELAEVAGGLGHDIVVELEDDAASGLAVDGDIKLKIRKKTLVSYLISIGLAIRAMGHGN